MVDEDSQVGLKVMVAALAARNALLPLWNPPRIAAVLLLGSVALALWPVLSAQSLANLWGSPAGFMLLVSAALPIAAAAGLWLYQRWAWILALLLQVAPPLLTMAFNPMATSSLLWWHQLLPRVLVLALLLLPATRRACVREQQPAAT